MDQLWIGGNCDPVEPDQLTEAIDEVLEFETSLQLYLAVDFDDIVEIPGREAFFAFLANRLPKPEGYEIKIVDFKPYTINDCEIDDEEILILLNCETRKIKDARKAAV